MIKVGDVVICTFGSNRGREFIIKKILFDGDFSCLSADNDGRYYRFSNTSVKKKGD